MENSSFFLVCLLIKQSNTKSQVHWSWPWQAWVHSKNKWKKSLNKNWNFIFQLAFFLNSETLFPKWNVFSLRFSKKTCMKFFIGWLGCSWLEIFSFSLWNEWKLSITVRWYENEEKKRSKLIAFSKYLRLCFMFAVLW